MKEHKAVDIFNTVAEELKEERQAFEEREEMFLGSGFKTYLEELDKLMVERNVVFNEAQRFGKDNSSITDWIAEHIKSSYEWEISPQKALDGLGGMVRQRA